MLSFDELNQLNNDPVISKHPQFREISKFFLEMDLDFTYMYMLIYYATKMFDAMVEVLSDEDAPIDELRGKLYSAYLDVFGDERAFNFRRTDIYSLEVTGTQIKKREKEDQPPKSFQTTLKGVLNEAFLIAVNESLIYTSYVQFEEKRENYQYKTWHTMEDERVRVAHQAMDGERVPINEPFFMDGYELMYPRDVETDPNIPPQYIVNCRCYLTFS